MSDHVERPKSVDVPITLLDDPNCPSRSSMDDHKLEELATSIRNDGLINPIAVVARGERFEVVAGHRRKIGCELAGLQLVPCRVFSSAGAALLAIQFAENAFREELSVHDEAVWFIELFNTVCNQDVDQVCVAVRRSRSYVEGRMNLASGCPEVFRALRDGGISIGVAVELNKIDDELMRKYYLRHAIDEGATVATAVSYVQQWRSSLGPAHLNVAPLAPADVTPVSDGYQAQRCCICDRERPGQKLIFLPIHDACHLAILQPMLEDLNARAGN